MKRKHSGKHQHTETSQTSTEEKEKKNSAAQKYTYCVIGLCKIQNMKY